MTKFVFKTKPRPHQMRALRFLLERGGGGLQVPMRYGKTKVAVDFVSVRAVKDQGIQRVLYTCPLDVIDVVAREIELHSSLPAKVTDVHGEVIGETKGIFPYLSRKPLLYVLVNFHMLWDRATTADGVWSVRRDSLSELQPNITIVDESHHIGDPTTLACKFVSQYGAASKHRVFMTGTMFHKRPWYIFGQFFFYDRSIFGGVWGHFKEEITTMGGFSGYKVLGYKNLKPMMRKVRKHVLIEKPKDFDMEPSKVVLPFRVEGRAMQAYKKMQRDGFVRLEDGSVAVSELPLTTYLRLAQIAAGHVTDEDGNTKIVGTHKAKLGTARIAEYASEYKDRIVVACQFTQEVEDATKACLKSKYTVRRITGHETKQERTAALAWFREETEEFRALVCQSAAASEGTDMSSSTTMLWWGLPTSYVVYDQMCNRIVKFSDFEPGSGRQLGYDFLIGRRTVDEITYEAMMHKKDIADHLGDNPELVERLSEIQGSK